MEGEYGIKDRKEKLRKKTCCGEFGEPWKENGRKRESHREEEVSR